MKRILAAVLLLAPSIAFAATAGTDGYLRGMGFTDSQLSTPVMTENREAFKAVEGTGQVTDPAGDVVDRTGVTSKIGAAWGDIITADLAKDETAQAWNVTVTLGEDVPETPSTQNQIFFLIDADGDTGNNDTNGYRIGTDAEFSILHTQEAGWHTGFRWYNKEADFWAKNKETAATFTTEGGVISLRIPFAEVSGSVTPRWRVVMALANGTDTQVDVAPGIGFPPPKGETYPESNQAGWSINDWQTWAVGIVALAVAGLAAGKIVAKKRQK